MTFLAAVRRLQTQLKAFSSRKVLTHFFGLNTGRVSVFARQITSVSVVSCMWGGAFISKPTAALVITA